MNKTCTRCRVERHVSEFYKDKRRADGLRYHCKACSNSYTYATRAENPDAARHAALMRKYNIGIMDYEAMLEEQGGVCAICAGTQRDNRPLCVDHDHDTGAVRGLLCYPCNSMIGLAKDNTETLARAIAYLEANK